MFIFFSQSNLNIPIYIFQSSIQVIFTIKFQYNNNNTTIPSEIPQMVTIFLNKAGGNSVVKVKLKGPAPKLRSIHPTCFEAGKPMEFFACGSNLMQPRFRYELKSHFRESIFCLFQFRRCSLSSSSFLNRRYYDRNWLFMGERNLKLADY